MLLNSQNLFFQSSNSQAIEKTEFEALAPQVRNIEIDNSAHGSFKKPRLTAKWHQENGKLVCSWST
ncbi:hypothetical protein BZZ01_03010 [Nostocales cyanobacterium HT-58-2]|nr:hypothetical protein BZZ01_03010 [Nostocales cyanobacterium HT-58-2]